MIKINVLLLSVLLGVMMVLDFKQEAKCPLRQSNNNEKTKWNKIKRMQDDD